MLLVKTAVKPDRFGGAGLFAEQDIAKGTPVWRYNPDTTLFMSVKDYFTLSGERKDEIEKYSYPVFSLDPDFRHIGLLLNLGPDRYMNHDTDPNTGEIGDGFDDERIPVEFALRDIARGEEMTSNYFTFDPLNVIHELGVITGKSFLMNTPHSRNAKPQDKRSLKVS